MNPQRLLRSEFHEDPQQRPAFSVIFAPHAREGLTSSVHSIRALGRALNLDRLKQRYLAGLEDSLSAAGTSLRPVVEALLNLGVTRKSLVDWAIAAGYSKGYIRSVLSRIIVASGRRERKPGPGRRTSPEALLILAFARERFGTRAAKHLLAAYRAATRQFTADALLGQPAGLAQSQATLVPEQPPPELCHRNKTTEEPACAAPHGPSATNDVNGKERNAANSQHP